MIQRHTYCFSEAMNERIQGQALHLETTRREGEPRKHKNQHSVGS